MKRPVLIVEDEAESRDSLRDLLELEGYEVATACHGADALAVIAGRADVAWIVLLDLFMPVMDGWELLDRLRADGQLDRLDVVITTSAPHTAPRGVPVLTKPIELDRMLQTLARYG